MIKRLPLVLLAALVVLGPATRAGAGTITFQDVFNPADQLFGKHSTGECVGNPATDTITGQDANGGCYSLSFLFQLTGYSNPPNTLTSAGLVLSVYDDDDPGNNPEDVTVTLNGIGLGTFAVVGFPASPFDVKAFVTPDGMLQVLLERGEDGGGQADFIFGQGVLNAAWLEDGFNATDEPDDSAPVPEPATMLLLGSGLVTGVGRRWRKTKG